MTEAEGERGMMEEKAMGTTRTEILEWIERGKAQNARWTIVVCDTFDWEDYPVFVTGGENLKEKVASYDQRNMQKIMEVYDLAGDIEAQIKLPRARADLSS
jgi:hypothetical protein